MTGRRVVYFSDSSYAGGAEAYLRMLADGLGHERASLLAVDHPGLRDWIAAWESSGFEVFRLRPAGLWATLRSLWSFAHRVRPELVHINAPGPYAGGLGLAPLALRWGGAGRIVVTEHLPSVGRVGRRFWSKRAGMLSIDSAICVCHAHRRTLIEVFGYERDRVVAIPNGIADPASPQTAREGLLDAWPKPRFLQVGSLDPRKGARELVSAFSQARGRAPDVGSLHLVGDGPLHDELTREVARLRLEECVVLHGHREDVPSLWASADVAVLASHREGLPLSLLEAMAFGLPILATPVDGVPELVHPERNGILVGAGDVSALAAAILRLSASAQLRQEWGRASRRAFEGAFELERMLTETYAIYGSPWSDAGTDS